jgi:hypothetical protein
MGTAPSRDSDRVRAKLPAIKVSGCHLVPVIAGRCRRSQPTWLDPMGSITGIK